MKPGLLFILLLISRPVLAQNPPYLERQITISFTQERLETALIKISEQGGFSFSYSNSVIENNRTITMAFVNKTVREILDELFNGAVEYKVRSKHVILTKSKKTSQAKDQQVLSGYVVDEATGRRLKNVSVYDPVTLSSAITDSYGYFEIKIDKPATNIKLSVNKQDYADTTVEVSSSRNRLMNIPIRIDRRKIAIAADSVSQKVKRFFKTKILSPRNPNLDNIDETFTRTFQFSLVPFVGSNHMMSGNVVNDYSLNLIGGYSRGNNILEIGGAFNINREDARGVQLAGVFNTVGGKFRGVQIAGGFNANLDNFYGAQIAGLANINWNSASEFSLAGGMNFTRIRSRGLHVAGLGNFTLGEQRGPHIAGLFNFATKRSGGLQLSSALNFAASDYHGGQLSGVLNFTGGNTFGSQIAGVMNFTGRGISGSQIAGVLNFASKVRGGQLGLINIADTVSGVPLGFFSFVLKGYHKLEFSADEIFYTNVAFRTGVRQFYNIFAAGVKPQTLSLDSSYWTFGYGVGTAPRITKWLSMNLDVTANQVMDKRKLDVINLLNKVYIGLDLHVTKHVSLTFGTTLNGYITDSTYEDYHPLFTHYQPDIIYERDLNRDLNLKMWWGGKVGLRFL